MKFAMHCVNCNAAAAWWLSTIVPFACAQTPSADEKVQSVQFKGICDPAMLPYQKAYDMISKIRDASSGHVQLVFRITSRESHAPIKDMSITIQGGKTYETLDISSAGYFSIPMNKEAYDDNADFISNVKKGTVEVGMFFVPNLPTDKINYADIVEVVKDAKLARADIVPWYWRIVMPTIGGIGICYPDDRQTVLIQRTRGEIRRPATNGDKSPDTDVFCANFTAKETELAPEDVVAPPAGWHPVFLGSMF